MGYPLYKETNYPRSCSLTQNELNLVFSGFYTSVEVHEADTHQLLRFVSRQEIESKWLADLVVPFGRDRSGKFKPWKKLRHDPKVDFYVVRW